MKKIYTIDTHQDIACGELYMHGQSFYSKSNTLHKGKNNYGLGVNNQSDYKRLNKANIKAVFAVSFAFEIDNNGAVITHRNHFDEIKKQINYYENLNIPIIKNKSDLTNISKNKLNFLLAVEGADSLNSEKMVDKYVKLGITCVGITWNHDNTIAGGADSKNGLSKIGEKIIKKLEQKNILIDLSHINEKSFWDIINIVKKPVIVSHTACFDLYKHPRNITDEQIKAIAKTGGAIGVGAISRFLTDHNSTIDDYIDHTMHVVNLVGIDHVIMGTDFGAMVAKVLVEDLQEVSDIPKVYKKLKERGLTEQEIAKIAHKNIERILHKTLPSI